MAKRLQHFLQGVGSVLDLWGVSAQPPVRRIRHKTLLESMVEDSQAISGDWQRIGNDIRATFVTGRISKRGKD